MALPPGIQAKTVTIGIASFADGNLASGRVTISLNVNVLHVPSNRPIFSSDMTKPFVDGMASFDLLPTDAPGLNRVDFSYHMKVEIQGARVQPDPIDFLLPTAGPDVVDLDGLVTVPSSAGIPISVDVLTTEDLPAAIAAGIQDAVDDGTIGATISTGASATAPALTLLHAALATASYVPVPLVFAGSSTTAGSKATVAAKRWVNLLIARAQAAYPSGLGSETIVASSVGADFPSPNTGVGVHGYNAGEGGTTSADYLTSAEVTKLAALAPRAVFHMVGSNDKDQAVTVATYKANVLAKIAAFRSAMTAPCAHILLHSYERYDTPPTVNGGAPWTSYRTALAEIAGAYPADVVLLDLSPFFVPLGIPSTDPFGFMDADKIHLNDRGHAYLFERMVELLNLRGGGSAAVSASDTTKPTISTFTAVPGNTQVQLNWSGSDNVAVTRWVLTSGATTLYDGAGSAYLHTGLTNGNPSSYSLVAYDAAGNASTTATATATPVVPSGYDYTTDAALLGEWDGDSLGTEATQVQTWTKKRGTWTSAFTQGTTAPRPYVSAVGAGLNGKKVLVFDGAEDYMAMIPTTKPQGPYTILSVWKSTAAATARIYGGNDTTAYASLNRTASGSVQASNGAGTTGGTVTSVGTAAASDPTADAALPHITAAVHDGASSRLYVDRKSSPVTGTLLTGDGTALNSIRIGASATPASYLNGYIAHLLVIGRALTASEVADTVQALATRYNLTVAA